MAGVKPAAGMLKNGPEMGEMPERTRGVTPPMKITPMGDRVRGVAPTQGEDKRTVTARDLPFLTENDLVTLTNVDDVTWEFRWDRKRYRVKPGESTHLPFPAVVMKMGDPRSMKEQRVRFSDHTGRRGFIAERHEELRRLMARYGVRKESMDDLVAFAPRVTVRTVDTGEVITFPVQDPEMVAYPIVDAPHPGGENTDMRRALDEQAAKNAELTERVKDMERLLTEKLGGADADDADDELPRPPRRAAPDGAQPPSVR